MNQDLAEIKARAAFHAARTAEDRAEDAHNYLVDTLECFGNIAFLLLSEPNLPASTREYTRLAAAFLADANERVWHGDLAKPGTACLNAGGRKSIEKKNRSTTHLVNTLQRTSHIG